MSEGDGMLRLCLAAIARHGITALFGIFSPARCARFKNDIAGFAAPRHRDALADREFFAFIVVGVKNGIVSASGYGAFGAMDGNKLQNVIVLGHEVSNLQLIEAH
jgi:hypothetical protein